MNAVFELTSEVRPTYILKLMHSFASSYICLWTYSPDHNFLYCEEGYYQEDHLLASSSSGSVARRLFDEYKDSVFTVGNEFVPGLAFRYRSPYLELQELNLHKLAAIESQRQFYQEARIKIAVFLGCERGEIELGMSYIPQVSLEMKMQSLFPQDFARPQQQQQPQPQQQQQQSRPSPSSSFSMDSPEYSSLLYTIPPPSSSYLQEQPTTTQAQTIPIASTTNLPAGFNQQLQNIPFPTPESTDAALTRAYLAILSSPPSISSSTMPYGSSRQEAISPKKSAFKSYEAGLGPRGPSQSMKSGNNLRRLTMMKRAIVYFRGLNYLRMQENHSSQGTARLHHMILERRRREKITESFQALRSLLPQGTKKDKATVLRTTKEYVSSLKSQVSELSKKNKILEAQLLIPRKDITTTSKQQSSDAAVSTNESLSVEVTPVSEPTSSQDRLVDLQVVLRGSNCPPTDLLIRVLEYLKQFRDQASLVSMEAQSIQEDPQNPTNWATFRLRIEGTEWDESTFKEAVRRILADLAQ